MSRYAFTAGHGSVVHLTQYNRAGEMLDTTFCGRTFNRDINVPLGRPTCKVCLRKLSEVRA